MGRTTTAPVNDTVLDATGKALHVGTNQRGRYALHTHHPHEPFLFENNVITGPEISVATPNGPERRIEGSPRWGIVNHNGTGTIRGNVVIGAEGSGIVAEDGLETGMVEGNLVIGTGGGSGVNDDERFGSSLGKDLAHGSFGYWFRGPFMEIKDNIATGHFRQAAFGFFTHPGFISSTFPDIEGMPPQYRGLSEADIVTKRPVETFMGNIADGFFGNAGITVFYNQAQHVFKDFTLTLRAPSGAAAIMTRSSAGVRFEDSTLMGGGDGTVVERDSDSQKINPIRTAISGFK
jgi:hypothetical protein